MTQLQGDSSSAASHQQRRQLLHLRVASEGLQRCVPSRSLAAAVQTFQLQSHQPVSVVQYHRQRVQSQLVHERLGARAHAVAKTGRFARRARQRRTLFANQSSLNCRIDVKRIRHNFCVRRQSWNQGCGFGVGF